MTSMKCRSLRPALISSEQLARLAQTGDDRRPDFEIADLHPQLLAALQAAQILDLQLLQFAAG